MVAQPASAGHTGGSTRVARPFRPLAASKGLLVILIALCAVPLPLLAQSGGDAARVSAAVHTRPLNLLAREAMQPNGSYEIALFREGRWVAAGSIGADRFFRTHALDLGPWPAEAPVRLRLAPRGGGAAHIDSVHLDGVAPTAALGAPLDKLGRTDFDVADASGRRIELTFAPPGRAQAGKHLALRLTARIEAPIISERAFMFPRANMFRPMDAQAKFYAYRLGDQPRRPAPGATARGEELGHPLFAESLPVESGHPQGRTYGWVSNDAERLYVVLDFTPDNTMDGDKDYAEVYAKTPQGLKAFRVTQSQTRWGRPSFVYTDKVPYQHKLYEFAIPLQELGLAPGAPDGTRLELAFAAYGTAVAGWRDTPAMAYDPHHNRYLLVYVQDIANNDQFIYGVFVGAYGGAVSAPFVISADIDYNRALDPAVAYDPTNRQFLVVWQDLYEVSVLYGQRVDADEGRLIGGNFVISDFWSGQEHLAVAHGENSDGFLVVWADDRLTCNGTCYFDIFGQFVNVDGTLVDHGGVGTPTKSNFQISIADDQQQFPAVAYDKANARFLVIWQDNRNNLDSSLDIYGQMVNADATLVDHGGTGTPAADNFAISTAASDQWFAALAYDPGNARFLAVWEDFRNGDVTDSYDIYGQMVNADGTLAAGNFAISTAANNQTQPAVAFSAVNAQYLVAWEDYRSGNDTDIYGLRIDPNGEAAPSGDFTIATQLNEQVRPAVAGNAACGSFLAVYLDYNVSPIDTQTALLGAPDCRVPGVAIGPPSGPASERGGSAYFTVVLDTPPVANVTVALASSDPGEATVSPTSLTFTPANWNAPQTVTVTGVNDNVADGNQVLSILFDTSASADFDYAWLSVAGLLVTNLDDETRGITIGPLSGPTSENGGTAVFTVALNSEPTNTVTLAIATSNENEGVPDADVLTFTEVDWYVPQTVTLTGVDDDVVDGNVIYEVTFDPAGSGDEYYGSLTVPALAVTNLDDELPGVVFGTITGPTTEAGGTATFTLRLLSQPAGGGSVSVALSSSDTGEATVNPASVIFTDEDWNLDQTVTVTGVDDALADGHQPFHIVTAPAVSADLAYSGLDVADVLAFNLDDETPLLSLVASTTEPAGANCAEGGQKIQFGLDNGLPAGTAGNGVLDAGEGSTQYVCNGATGSTGSTGSTGAAGTASLVSVSDEPAGSNCPAGGKRIDSGLDGDGDLMLDVAEIDVTSYVCNGATGATGGTGSSGITSLIDVTDEPAGANCASGGRHIDLGLDSDGDAVLDANEVTSTSYVCNGTAGAAGTTSLVSVSDEPAGANCPDGGQRLSSGLDLDGDSLLDPEEITGTLYVCTGEAIVLVPGLTFPTDTPTGVTPSGGPAGGAFTFKVVYTSAENKAPKIAELWIDLDGNGHYVAANHAAEGAATSAPPRGDGPPWLPALPGLGALWLLALLTTQRRRGLRPALATTGLLLGVSLFLAQALAGCDTGGGGGGESKPPPSGTTLEVFRMAPADTSDTNYADGATYTYTMTIGGLPRDVTYRFVFFDDTSPAMGVPTAEQTLIVN